MNDGASANYRRSPDTNLIRISANGKEYYQEMKWIKVEDQPVPKEGVYLVFYQDSYMSIVEHLYDDDNGKPTFFDGGSCISDVTHWMPLLEKPE